MDPRRAVKHTLLAGARLAGGAWHGQPGPLILTYHSVGRAGVPYTVADDVFRAQMRTLLEGGHRLLTVSELGQSLAGGALPRRAVCVTFDDAFVNAMEPIRWLVGLGGKVTLYVVAAEPGHNHWDEHDRAIPRLPRMGWDQLRALAAGGVEIGSHTVSHPHLPRLDDGALREELRGSRAILQRQLDAPVESLAYPYGEYDGRVVRAAADAGYRLACTMDYCYVSRRSRPLLLPRMEPDSQRELQDVAAGHSHLFYRVSGAAHRARNELMLLRGRFA